MNKLNLTIDVENEHDIKHVQITGEIDVYTASTLKEKLIPLTEKKGQIVKVNLENTTHLDSTGLGVFIHAYKSSEEHESTLQLVHAQDRILRLFKVTGLHKIMDISTDEEEREERNNG